MITLNAPPFFGQQLLSRLFDSIGAKNSNSVSVPAGSLHVTALKWSHFPVVLSDHFHWRKYFRLPNHRSEAISRLSSFDWWLMMCTKIGNVCVSLALVTPNSPEWNTDTLRTSRPKFWATHDSAYSPLGTQTFLSRKF